MIASSAVSGAGGRPSLKPTVCAARSIVAHPATSEAAKTARHMNSTLRALVLARPTRSENPAAASPSHCFQYAPQCLLDLVCFQPEPEQHAAIHKHRRCKRKPPDVTTDAKEHREEDREEEGQKDRDENRRAHRDQDA